MPGAPRDTPGRRAAAEMSGPGRAALVTGATGFIGRHVVRRLLADGRRVVAFARSRPQAAARDRVARAVGTWTRGHLQVVEGDLVEPDAGLDGATMGELRETVETVIHCAGDATFFPEAGGRYRAGDVEGPCRLLEPLHGGRLARWAHLSTARVSHRRLRLELCRLVGIAASASAIPTRRQRSSRRRRCETR